MALVRYGAASALSLASIYAGSAGLHEIAGWSEEAAYGTTLVAVFFVNFLVLRHWVYGDTKSGGKAARQLVHTAAASAGFRGVEYALFLLLHAALGLNYLVAIGVVAVLLFFGKFVYYRKMVFAADESETPA